VQDLAANVFSTEHLPELRAFVRHLHLITKRKLPKEPAGYILLVPAERIELPTH
jgi:hypothetical protein